MLAAASSFFGRTNISQTYNIGAVSNGSRTGTPTPGSSSAALPQVAHAPPFQVGPWRVQTATHKVNGKRVSVWSADKRSGEMERMGPLSKEKTLEVLKTEASALSRLRHPSILEMVEPLEETRTELVFATEPVLSSLHLSIPGSPQYTPLVELDEVEIQKGILQLCKGLHFLHTSARLIHSNITPESIIINSSGDWKLSGLGLTISLGGQGGAATRWEFPTFDGRAMSYTQRSFDYIAPEYALDEVLDPASDMYSLGCLMYAVHCKGNPPFKNHGSLGGLRENAGKPLVGMERLDGDLRAVLNQLITRLHQSRPTPTALPQHPFFSSLPISTLNFLDRSNFAAKSREEKISFMKGLTSVLERFSEGLQRRKILPSLLEEMKDTHLLPYILPNVFVISQMLTPTQFASMVLPSLKPLFAVKEPPQNMITLLDNLQMLQNKTEKQVFREHVLPLVYNALESEHAQVQERALKAIPDLCETIDYAEVQGVMFPRVALVFTKTRILTVKVATLTTFLSMVKTLDQSSLTQKLVPLLSKIRTKEPAVTMATLAVQEAMGLKVDREAVATLVLPQLWAMSIGPLLTVSQFKRFMEVIKKLGDRVEKEHDQYLRDSQRIEEHPPVANGVVTPQLGGNVDFESLVGGAAGSGSVKSDTTGGADKSWDDDDVWGSIFSNGQQSTSGAAPASPPPLPMHSQQATQSLPSSPKQNSLSLGSASRVRTNTGFGTPTSYNLSTTQRPATQARPSFPPPQRSSLSTAVPLVPQTQTSVSTIPTNSAPAPNYNISLTPATMPTTISPPLQPALAPQPSFVSQPPPNAPINPMSYSSAPLVPSGPTMASMGSVLAPSKPPQPSWTTGGGSKQLSQADWGDFDPLA
ncbi:other/SCY1 protein kinase [Cristinia sonorae]|uniref:Other/SCY1 protein kinase n=1 Tax=Cristinia sonorae TaxID=1940300 RepID=A0A8K0UYU2_9AGAR|nr:other/SCY1 protein kinase [Cristinia sonorae]